MKKDLIKSVILALLSLWVWSCNHEEAVAPEAEAPADVRHTPMTFAVVHPAQRVRVVNDAFEDGDQVGVFVHATDTPLEIGGNLVNNEALTCNGGNWTASRPLYWDEGTFNACAYYPYVRSVGSIEDLPFSISTDQQADAGNGMDGYEASDFLYARTEGVSASDSPVRLTFGHIMSKLTVRLIKGEDFEGDMPTDAEVYVHNTVPSATIDLNAGVATRYVRGTNATIRARQESDFIFSAIVVPQRVDNRVPLVEVIMKGVSYVFESRFQFKPGVEHLVNMVISDNPDQAKIEIGGEIQDWQ